MVKTLVLLFISNADLLNVLFIDKGTIFDKLDKKIIDLIHRNRGEGRKCF